MMASLFSQKGTVLESCDPYQDSDVECITSCPYQQTVLDWRIISSDSIADTEVLKQYIYDHGPVIVSMYADTSEGFDGTYDGSYTFDYITPGDATNHSVLIVGWSNDLPPVPGGGTTPADGWIVKNSWGPTWGDGGYFFITYGAANIGMWSSFIHDWQAYDAYGDIWYYDDDGWWSPWGYGTTTTAWGLVKFIPPADADVTRVEFWTNDATSDVDVYLYDDFDGSALDNLLAEKLDNSFELAGYHSVALDVPVAVTSGDDVIAVVKFTNVAYTYPIVADPHGTIEAERTYISSGGTGWTEMGLGYGTDVAIRLRTHTPAPAVTGIIPSRGENIGPVSITDLAGSSFQPGATVTLAKPGQADIDASNVVVVDSTQITCDFDLTGAATGAWDVVVTNPDTQSDTLAGAFMVYTSVPSSLSLGWNLISLQLEPLDPAPEEVLSSIAGEYDAVFAYEGCDPTGPWKRYDPDGGGDDLTTMGVERGYWVHTTSSATLTLTGTLPSSMDIPLCTGWNLVGYPAQTPRPVAEALSSIEGLYTLVQTFDPADPADPWKHHDVDLPVYANDLTLMEPGMGYWIYVTAACTLSLEP
jgi:hypothetical protein